MNAASSSALRFVPPLFHRLLASACLLCNFSTLAAERSSLFDGKTLEGWEGNLAVWRVQEGTIVGGSMTGNPRNEFLATQRTYRNFVLRVEFKLVGTEGFVNGGVQIRSRRIAQPAHEMIGYQADIGAGYTGALYDESRRKKFLAQPDKALAMQTEKVGDWNTYEIRSEGPRVQLLLNGRRTADYTEREPGIETDGFIALQIHGNCKAEIAFRDISIEVLPDGLVPSETEIMKRLQVEPVAQSAPGRKAAMPNSPLLQAGDVIATMGQANLDRDARAGVLESVLNIAFAEHGLRFRPMAWEGDTVYQQWREANFGNWSSQFEAVGATLVIAQFGQMESLDGAARLKEFTTAYTSLLKQVPPQTRLVVLSPTPFETLPGGQGPDVVQRNADLQAYCEAIRGIAQQRGALYLDLFTPLLERGRHGVRCTENGVHLSATGREQVAQLVLAAAGGKSTASPAKLATLREAIQEKNRVWFECWRPANWAFAFGDRVTWPYSKPAGAVPALRDIFSRHGAQLTEEEARVRKLVRGAAPAGPLSASDEQKTFTVADGFEVNLFADETLGVVKPTQFAWDERGRLFVGCSPTYPQPVPTVRPGDYVLLLEDTDGDGRADKTSRFAEGLTMVLGVEPGDGGVYVCDYDQLVHLVDTDGDGRADQRRVVLSGFGVGDTHQMINSVSHGPDGSLWFSQGLHSFSRVETPWGVTVLEKAGLWRFRPRTQRLDAFFNGARAGHNCWGVAFDDYGQMFHKSGDRPAGYYSVPGLVPLSEPDEYHPTGALFSSETKTTGLEIIGTTALPENLQGAALIAGFFGNTIEIHRFHDDGAGFQTEQAPKLLRSTSPDFRPVDVAVGPDGAIYVADWYNPIIGHYQASYADPNRDKKRGRIWRITAKKHSPVARPQLAGQPAATLLEQLRSPERWTRYQAKRMLFERPSAEVIGAADTWWRKLDPRDAATGRLLVDVIGLYQAHETVRPELLAKLLGSSDSRVRAYGYRVAGDWADRLPDILSLLERGISDPQPRVRLEAIVACSRAPAADAATVAVHAIDLPRDRFIDYALAQTLRSLQPTWDIKGSSVPAIVAQKPYTDVFARVKSREKIAEPAGKAVYDNFCLNCHQPDGRGLADMYPPVGGSTRVSGEKEKLIKIVLHGLTGPLTSAGKQYGLNGVVMPPAPLDDQQIAAVLTFVRSSFGNSADAVTPDLVRRVRSQSEGRRSPWTLDELTGP